MVAKYATVDEYFRDLQSLNLTYPTYDGDFLPYVQLENFKFDYWTGYYSSTLLLKREIREAEQGLRALKAQVFA